MAGCSSLVGISSLVILFAFTGVVQMQNCDEDRIANEVRKCQEPLTEIMQSKVFATDRVQLRKLCGDMNTAISCFNDLMSKCVPAGSKRKEITELFSGVKDFLSELCDENSPLSKEYLENAPCMAKVQDQIEACSAHGTSTMKQQQSQLKSQEESIDLACCTAKRMLECSSDVYLKNCGEKAASISHRSIMMAMGPIKSMCVDANDNFKCSSAMCFQPAAILFALAAIVWAYQQRLW